MATKKIKQIGDTQYCYMKRTLIQRSIDDLKKLATELVAWATNNEDAITVKEFLCKRKIGKKCWYRWVFKYDFVKEANDFALQVIADRRERGAITGKYNSNTIIHFQAMYDPEYKEFMAWRETIKQKSVDNLGKIEVVIPPCPNSPMVPKKDENRNAD